MKFSNTVTTFATPEKIWAIWTDVDNWSVWDTELCDSYLESPFKLGAIGKLTPKTGTTSKFTISQFSPGKSYTFTIQLPFCKLNVHRYLSIYADSTSFTHEVSFKGALAFLFGWLLGKKFKKVLPRVMENIREIAEAKSIGQGYLEKTVD
ncbi:SRPBCC family protein [Nostoc muscorum FACHB-395]|jgi:hypothetical protein|nr:SRPBCC family protein [Desmonostoc muscorum FACHB-395]